MLVNWLHVNYAFQFSAAASGMAPIRHLSDYINPFLSPVYHSPFNLPYFPQSLAPSFLFPIADCTPLPPPPMTGSQRMRSALGFVPFSPRFATDIRPIG